MLYGVGYPFDQLGSTALAISPSNFLCPPTSPLPSGVAEEAENSSILFQHCSATAEISLKYQLYFGHKSKHRLIKVTSMQTKFMTAKISTAVHIKVTWIKSVPLGLFFYNKCCHKLNLF